MSYIVVALTPAQQKHLFAKTGPAALQTWATINRIVVGIPEDQASLSFRRQQDVDLFNARFGGVGLPKPPKPPRVAKEPKPRKPRDPTKRVTVTGQPKLADVQRLIAAALQARAQAGGVDLAALSDDEFIAFVAQQARVP